MILWKPTWSTLRRELKEDISRLSLIVTFSRFYSLVLQPWSFTSRERKILFKALFSCLEFWLCLQTCLSPTYILLPLSLWINYLTPSFSPLFFLILSLWPWAPWKPRMSVLKDSTNPWFIWTPHPKTNSLHPWAETSFKYAEFSQHSD